MIIYDDPMNPIYIYDSELNQSQLTTFDCLEFIKKIVRTIYLTNLNNNEKYRKRFIDNHDIEISSELDFKEKDVLEMVIQELLDDHEIPGPPNGLPKSTIKLLEMPNI